MNPDWVNDYKHSFTVWNTWIIYIKKWINTHTVTENGN